MIVDSTTAAPSHQRQRSLWLRVLLALLAASAGFSLAVWILPGVQLSTPTASFETVGLISLINAVVWPVLARWLTPLLVFTLGIASLLINGAIVMLAGRVIPGFTVDSWGSAILVSLLTTATTIAISSALAIDDDHVWRRNMIRQVNESKDIIKTDQPGVLFIQIDGLGHGVLVRALQDGYMPTLSGWIRRGSHQLIEWETDLSSQTGASQAGILHGNNHNMPAFRWYDKDSKHVFVTNRPGDAAAIQTAQSNGKGLLVDGGASLSNVFSGDSPDSLMTFSTVLHGDDTFKHGLAGFFADPYSIARVIVLGAADVWRELVARRRARIRDTIPRLPRKGIYPILRAGTTIGLRELAVNSLIADIYRGVPSAYVDFVGYDEVAHHSGISAYDALETLYRLDQQFARLLTAIEGAPRPYEIVVLSDHGQSQGSTFKQRYGHSLGDVVRQLSDVGASVVEPEMPSEGWGNINSALTSQVNEKNRISAVMARLLRSRTVDGEVRLGQDRRISDEVTNADAVVLASGNLGLVSFPDLPGRATLEQINDARPGLIAGLTQHPGIGWILVDSDADGGLVFGPSGVRYLKDDRVEGEDPLGVLEPGAVAHIKRTHSFNNTPDLLIGSFYDPQLQEAAAFEELIGFHGGLGGPQSNPFILHPTHFETPADRIVGAGSVYSLFKGWLQQTASGQQAASSAAPAKAPARASATKKGSTAKKGSTVKKTTKAAKTATATKTTKATKAAPAKKSATTKKASTAKKAIKATTPAKSTKTAKATKTTKTAKTATASKTSKAATSRRGAAT